MTVKKLGHISIRTTDLASTVGFYRTVVGLREGFRPPFEFPGAWLYRGGDEADFGTLHVIEVRPESRAALVDYLGDIPDSALAGSGAVDHIAFLMDGIDQVRKNIEKLGIPMSEKRAPSVGLHQIFVRDPSGITVELNFPLREAHA